MRRKLIAGNWKMNTDLNSANKLVKSIQLMIEGRDINSELLICPPFTNLNAVNDLIQNSQISLGAQNCDYRKSGAFTGEISTDMLKSVGCKYVIIGHSERRQFFGDTNEIVNLKVKNAINTGIIPILCIGETIDERNAGNTFNVLAAQIKIAYQNIELEDLSKIVIAYEPVWAIGTGVSATNEQAGEAHTWIRNYLMENYGKDSSDIRILYGGSMNEKNSFDLLSLPDIDGGLIGGASLKADSFISILNNSELTYSN
jgi:triosephosphate isomerase